MSKQSKYKMLNVTGLWNIKMQHYLELDSPSWCYYGFQRLKRSAANIEKMLNNVCQIHRPAVVKVRHWKRYSIWKYIFDLVVFNILIFFFILWTHFQVTQFIHLENSYLLVRLLLNGSSNIGLFIFCSDIISARLLGISLKLQWRRDLPNPLPNISLW